MNPQIQSCISLFERIARSTSCSHDVSQGTLKLTHRDNKHAISYLHGEPDEFRLVESFWYFPGENSINGADYNQ